MINRVGLLPISTLKEWSAPKLKDIYKYTSNDLDKLIVEFIHGVYQKFTIPIDTIVDAFMKIEEHTEQTKLHMLELVLLVQDFWFRLAYGLKYSGFYERHQLNMNNVFRFDNKISDRSIYKLVEYYKSYESNLKGCFFLINKIPHELETTHFGYFLGYLFKNYDLQEWISAIKQKKLPFDKHTKLNLTPIFQPTIEVYDFFIQALKYIDNIDQHLVDLNSHYITTHLLRKIKDKTVVYKSYNPSKKEETVFLFNINDDEEILKEFIVLTKSSFLYEQFFEKCTNYNVKYFEALLVCKDFLYKIKKEQLNKILRSRFLDVFIETPEMFKYMCMALKDKYTIENGRLLLSKIRFDVFFMKKLTIFASGFPNDVFLVKVFIEFCKLIFDWEDYNFIVEVDDIYFENIEPPSMENLSKKCPYENQRKLKENLDKGKEHLNMEVYSREKQDDGTNPPLLNQNKFTKETFNNIKNTPTNITEPTNTDKKLDIKQEYSLDESNYSMPTSLALNDTQNNNFENLNTPAKLQMPELNNDGSTLETKNTSKNKPTSEIDSSKSNLKDLLSNDDILEVFNILFKYRNFTTLEPFYKPIILLNPELFKKILFQELNLDLFFILTFNILNNIESIDLTKEFAEINFQANYWDSTVYKYFDSRYFERFYTKNLQKSQLNLHGRSKHDLKTVQTKKDYLEGLVFNRSLITLRGLTTFSLYIFFRAYSSNTQEFISFKTKSKTISFTLINTKLCYTADQSLKVITEIFVANKTIAFTKTPNSLYVYVNDKKFKIPCSEILYISVGRCFKGIINKILYLENSRFEKEVYNKLSLSNVKFYCEVLKNIEKRQSYYHYKGVYIDSLMKYDIVNEKIVVKFFNVLVNVNWKDCKYFDQTTQIKQ